MLVLEEQPWVAFSPAFYFMLDQAVCMTKQCTFFESMVILEPAGTRL